MDPELGLRALAALGVIGAFLFALRRLPQVAFRRLGASRRLAVLESSSLPGGASLHLVSVAGRYLVVGRGAAQVTLLCELTREQIGLRAHPGR